MDGCHRCRGFAASLVEALQPTGFTPTASAFQDVDFGDTLANTAVDVSTGSAKINGSPVGVNLMDAGATSITYELASTPQSGDTVELSYAPPPYDAERASDGVKVGPFTVSGVVT